MVSVEQLQKANHLSKELKKHGFANDMGDAYNQAMKIVDKDKKAPNVGIAENKDVVAEPAFLSDEELTELQDRMRRLERFKDFNQASEEGVKKEIDDLRGKLDKVLKSIQLIEMNQITFEKQLEDFHQSAGPVQLQQQPQETVQQAQEPVPHKPQENLAPEKVNSPAEAAGFKHEEVAVENIFYSGSK